MAIAPLPVINSILSVPSILSAVAIRVSPRLKLIVGVGRFHGAGYLFFVLTAIAESVRTLVLFLDLTLQPGLVTGLVFPPRFPLAVVIGEGDFVDHRHAVLDRANRLAHSAAAAGFHVGVIESFGSDVEAGIRALQ